MTNNMDEMKDGIQQAVETWLKLAAENNKHTTRLFKADDETRSSFMETIVRIFDGDVDQMSFVFTIDKQSYSVHVDSDSDGYITCKLTPIEKKRPKTKEEWDAWWIENNPHMLDEPAVPKFDNTQPNKQWKVNYD